MARSQKRSEQTPTGGLYIASRKKRLNELGSDPTHTRIGKASKQSVRILGGNEKRRLVTSEIANVYDPATKKYSQAKVKNSVENKANRNFSRRNILTKGSVIETEAGKAKITSRPGQHGVINAVLVK